MGSRLLPIQDADRPDRASGLLSGFAGQLNVYRTQATLDLIATTGIYTLLGGLLLSFEIPIDADIAAAFEADPI